MAWGKTERTREMEVDALIGPQVVIHGDVVFSGSLYVEGRIVGKVLADEGATAVLTVAEHGVVEGQIKANVVVLAGRMLGDIYASERVELAPTARVEGNVHYDVVEMHAGAQLTGRLLHASAAVQAVAAGVQAEPAARAEVAEA